MIRLSQIKIQNDGQLAGYTGGTPDPAMLRQTLTGKAAGILHQDPKRIRDLKILSHSIDARKKPNVLDVYEIAFHVLAGKQGEKVLSEAEEQQLLKRAHVKNGRVYEPEVYAFPVQAGAGKSARPVVVGAGPGGLFAAYELAKAGFRPILIERGQPVEQRKQDVDRFWETGALDPESNVQFGEGGAGSFSDGKLNTVVKDPAGRAGEVLETFIACGATEDIAYEHKPHIGTDLLMTVIANLRGRILEAGGEIRYGCKMERLILEDGCVRGLRVLEQGKRSEIQTDCVILAIGHSARDTFEVLLEQQVPMEPKAFAVGLRVEHPQERINASQYGMPHPISLPAAPYKLTARAESGRGVYSFCMCPGGYVVNASSEEGYLAVNGMSLHARDSRLANSAIVISVTPEDYPGKDPLSGVRFQRELEQKAYKLCDGRVPYEYYDEFRDRRKPAAHPERVQPLISGQAAPGAVHEILTEAMHRDFVEGMQQFGRKIRGFDAEDAIVIGVESRTSSPVRMERGEDLQSVGIRGLFPCGEGAGYAGGIMSAAMDGIKCAEAAAKVLFNPESKVPAQSAGTEKGSDPVAEAKRAMRKTVLAKRDAIPVSERHFYDEIIRHRLLHTKAYADCRRILIYCSRGSEVDTDGIIHQALLDGKEVYCPRVEDRKAHRMEFVRIGSMEALQPGLFEIREPVGAQILEPEQLEEAADTLVILPGTVFDPACGRLGYAGSYYDRYCTRLKAAHTMAIAYEEQLVPEVPQNELDVRPESVMTQRGEYKCQK